MNTKNKLPALEYWSLKGSTPLEIAIRASERSDEECKTARDFLVEDTGMLGLQCAMIYIQATALGVTTRENLENRLGDWTAAHAACGVSPTESHQLIELQTLFYEYAWRKMLKETAEAPEGHPRALWRRLHCIQGKPRDRIVSEIHTRSLGDLEAAKAWVEKYQPAGLLNFSLVRLRDLKGSVSLCMQEYAKQIREQTGAEPLPVPFETCALFLEYYVRHPEELVTA